MTQHGPGKVVIGDCRAIMPALGPYDLIVADPPYGAISLAWDRHVEGWLPLALAALRPSGSMWVFGSLRCFMATAADLHNAGWKYAQEIVWEKQNGTNFRNDRFRRVHELVAQFYRGDAAWRDIYNDVRTAPGATAGVVRRKRRPPHFGRANAGRYLSSDARPRLMRSVIYARNAHGHAIHPTEKPVALIDLLVRTSCPPDGLVGDWFAGSGAAGEACKLAGRRYIGCELDSKMASLARSRIARARPSFEDSIT